MSTLSFDAGRLAKHHARKRINVIALTLAMAAMAFGLFWLIWILIETVRLGLGGLAVSVFTESTPPPLAESGGLANAIVGSLMMVSLATAWVAYCRAPSTWPAAVPTRTSRCAGCPASASACATRVCT